MSDVTVNLNSNPVSVNFGNLDTVSGASALTIANRLVKVSGSGGVTMATIAESGITGVLTLTKTGSTARTATFPDAAIEVQAADEEKSADFTARLHGTYLVTASCTVTDPTPAQGHEYIVFVRNGTCTIGGVGYAAGQTIKRSYHSGAWSSTVLAALGVAQTFSAINTFSSATASTSTSTGAVVISAGGLGVSGAGFFGGAVTVPNGTAAAPGLRLTSEASGLYRVSSTSLGFSAAGVSVGQWDTTATGSRLVLNSATSTGADNTMMCGGRTMTATSATYGVDLRPVWAPTATSASQSQGFLMRYDINATAGDVTAPMASTPAAHYVQAVVAAGNVTSIAGFTAAIFNLGAGTLTSGAGLHVRSPTNSGGGAITNLYGLRIEAQNIGTNRYGIDIANISGGTTNFAIRTGSGIVSIGDTTAATNTTSGCATFAGGIGVAGAGYFGGAISAGTQLGVGTTPSTAIGINVTQTALAGASQYGHLLSVTATSAATSVLQMFTCAPATAAASFTCGQVQGFRYQNVSIGSGSAVTTQYAIRIDALSGAGTNYAFSSAGAGLVQIGDTTSSTSTTTGALTVAGGIGVAKEIVMPAADYIYFGSTASDGSWRFGRSGNDFIHQRRESGVWVTKQTIAA